jgi:hypothetical protein
MALEAPKTALLFNGKQLGRIDHDAVFWIQTQERYSKENHGTSSSRYPTYAPGHRRRSC